jgi:hypothetical protein
MSVDKAIKRLSEVDPGMDEEEIKDRIVALQDRLKIEMEEAYTEFKHSKKNRTAEDLSFLADLYCERAKDAYIVSWMTLQILKLGKQITEYRELVEEQTEIIQQLTFKRSGNKTLTN